MCATFVRTTAVERIWHIQDSEGQILAVVLVFKKRFSPPRFGGLVPTRFQYRGLDGPETERFFIGLGSQGYSHGLLQLAILQRLVSEKWLKVAFIKMAQMTVSFVPNSLDSVQGSVRGPNRRSIQVDLDLESPPGPTGVPRR